MRRTPEATALSLTILSRPISPVRRTCVPPQSSMEYAWPAWARWRLDAHGDDAHLIAVFLAEQRQRAFGDGFVGRHQMRLDGRVLQDHGVDPILDRADLLHASSASGARNRSGAGPGSTSEPFCATCVAQHLAQRLVQEMRRRMIGARRRAARMIDRRARPPRPASMRPSRPRRHAGTGRAASSACRRRRSARRLAPEMVPRSPTWPPDSA